MNSIFGYQIGQGKKPKRIPWDDEIRETSALEHCLLNCVSLRSSYDGKEERLISPREPTSYENAGQAGGSRNQGKGFA